MKTAKWLLNIHLSATALAAVLTAAAVDAERMTTSSVLTINLTNALVLGVMKLLVCIAWKLGKFSFWTYPGLGGWGPGFGRIGGGGGGGYNPFDLSVDLRWGATYFWSLNKGEWGCLMRMACENPDEGRLWLWAGELLMSERNPLRDWLPNKRLYEWLLVKFAAATRRGEAKERMSVCDEEYPCRAFFALTSYEGRRRKKK